MVLYSNSIGIFWLLNIRTMATSFSPCSGVLWLKPIPKYCNVWYEGILRISRLVDWCFTPLSTVFQSYHGENSHYSSLSWVSPVLGWGSEMSCPRTLPRKKPENPVRLEPRTPRLRVKHLRMTHAGPLYQAVERNRTIMTLLFIINRIFFCLRFIHVRIKTHITEKKICVKTLSSTV